MKQITLAIILLLTISCTSKKSENSLASANSVSDCQKGLNYYRANNIEVIEEKATATLIFSGKINLVGKGIISGKPALYICNDEGAVTIAGMGDIKIDKTKASEAIKVLAPIFLIQADGFAASDKQKKLFESVGTKLQSNSDWNDAIEDAFILRVMTVQADADGNYFLVIQAGNRKSYTN